MFWQKRCFAFFDGVSGSSPSEAEVVATPQKSSIVEATSSTKQLPDGFRKAKLALDEKCQREESKQKARHLQEAHELQSRHKCRRLMPGGSEVAQEVLPRRADEIFAQRVEMHSNSENSWEAFSVDELSASTSKSIHMGCLITSFQQGRWRSWCGH